MWTLLIISFIQEHNDYKVTRFNDYVTEQQCTINRAVLDATFTEGEKAVCVYEMV